MKTKPTASSVQYRQGDLLIERVPALPAGAAKLKPDAGRVILAHGEVTGHAHEIAEPQLATLHECRAAVHLLGDLDDYTGLDTALDLKADTSVVHHEHGAIPLGRDTYIVRRQREYSPEEIRRVKD